MRKEDILSPQNSEDEEKTSRDHKENQDDKGETEDERKRGMDILQPDDGNIPEQKNKKEENQTGKDQ
jgi:hypothetical protein